MPGLHWWQVARILQRIETSLLDQHTISSLWSRLSVSPRTIDMEPDSSLSFPSCQLENALSILQRIVAALSELHSTFSLCSRSSVSPRTFDMEPYNSLRWSSCQIENALSILQRNETSALELQTPPSQHAAGRLSRLASFQLANVFFQCESFQQAGFGDCQYFFDFSSNVRGIIGDVT